MRGIAGVLERSWYTEPGAGPAWTRPLAPLALLYGFGSALARRRAASTRSKLPDVYVIAVGNLTVGGTGKSSIARWIAEEAAREGVRAAVLLRGHGARRAGEGPGAVPDFEGYPLLSRADRFGDEAIAHRLALPRAASVAVDPNRFRAARAASSGYGARLLVLDDGWEQSSLSWDELWVAVDPIHPQGNGALLPAGPLRRPPCTLREASRIVFLTEEAGEAIPKPTLEWTARHAAGVPLLRFHRTLRGLSPLGQSLAVEPLPRGLPVALVSGIGSPRRLERFVRAAEADIRYHAAYPDHARWTPRTLQAELARARRAGAEAVWTTEKDESRWPEALRAPLPVRVLRTGVALTDPVEDRSGPLGPALAAASGMGYADTLHRNSGPQ